MIDVYGRNIDYLRLSITDRCNLRCRYCMPAEIPFVPHESILRYEELLRVSEIAARIGIRHLKVTGGEPLVRRDCAEFVRNLKQIDGIETVTMTTNGILLFEQAQALQEAGIDCINISLDTLSRERYAAITGTDALSRVLLALSRCLELGVRVKINCVPLASTPMEELLDVAALAQKFPVDVRMIEMMPIGSGADFAPTDLDALLLQMQGRWQDLRPDESRHGFGPANYYHSEQLAGSIGFIRAVSHNFCAACNRVRLTSEGYLKLCLCHGDGLDMRALLRGGADNDTIQNAMQNAIMHKPAHHSFGEMVDEQRIMAQIGG